VLKSFGDKDSEALAQRRHVAKFQSCERAAQRRLRELDIATTLSDLAAIPGNHLEALKGNRKGQHSIRINDQWRICFRWKDGDAFDVEIVDYH
jgi:proteic killer suppression protein